MKRLRLVLTLASLTLLAAPAGAQDRGRKDDVPPAYKPPPGMCRIWLDNVPPGQQPAPTDCATAIRNRPSNGRVIFGEELKDKGKRFRKANEKKQPDSRFESWSRDALLDRTTLGDRSRGDPRADDDEDSYDESALPEMSGTALFARGIRTDDVERWLGRARVSPRTTDDDRDGVPERISWMDAATGAPVQVWTDLDGDGWADRVELFRDGRRVRVIGAR